MSRSEIATGYAWSIIVDRSDLRLRFFHSWSFWHHWNLFLLFCTREYCTVSLPVTQWRTTCCIWKKKYWLSRLIWIIPVSCQARPPPASAKMYQPVPWTENPPYFIVNPFFESLVFWWYETNPPSFVGSPDESFHDISKWNSNWNLFNN